MLWALFIQLCWSDALLLYRLSSSLLSTDFWLLAFTPKRIAKISKAKSTKHSAGQLPEFLGSAIILRIILLLSRIQQPQTVLSDRPVAWAKSVALTL